MKLLRHRHGCRGSVGGRAVSTRPDCVEDEHLAYLDDLRQSGVTNMWGAGTYVQREFGVSRKEAQEITLYWMATFSQRHQRPTPPPKLGSVP